jgi:hypothetical protein
MVALDKTPNIIYNIVNFEEPNVVFMYGVLMLFFIIIFSKLDINYGMLIGLLFYSIVVYYFYTERNENYVYETEKYNQKFEKLQRPTKILKEYPEIVDFLFYIEDMRKHSYLTYEKISNLFREFCTLYRDCNVDYNLIDSLYQKMVDIKIAIMYEINIFTYNTDGYAYTNKIFKAKEEAERILNKMLDELTLIQKKKIYYNGYNIKSKVIDTSGVLPYNIVKGTNPSLNNIDIPQMSDLIVF